MNGTKKWALTGVLFSMAMVVISALCEVLYNGDIYMLISVIAIVLIYFGFPKKHTADPECMLFRLPPEVIACILVLCATGMTGGYDMVRWYRDSQTGFDWQAMFISNLIGGLVYGYGVWYAGTLAEMVGHTYKVNFLKRSLCYRVYCFIKEKIEEKRRKYVEGIMTDEECKRLKKIIIWNGVILAAISCCCFFGLPLLLIYVIVVYKIIKKSVNEVKAGYQTLSDSLNRICEGQSAIVDGEDFAAYTDLKDKLVNISNGMQKAVSEEVKSERMKMELVSNVSHDLKTPLTAMITYIDLLKEEKDEEKRKEYTDIISKRAERLKFLIEDLFEVTKATTGNIKLEPVKMDIVNLVKQVTVEYEDRLKKSNLEIVASYPENRVEIMADSQKTYRIFSNLIGNAAKYSLNGSRVYIDIEENETEAMIVVKNISSTKLNLKGEELMERFVRGDSSRNTEGSGLGLAIAKSFADAQGGSLDIIVDGDLFKAVVVMKK